jgi:guanylate kinase
MAGSPAPTNALKRRGLMFVLSSPSGAGKTTISHMLLADDQEIKLSVSVTTRPMRVGERDGIDYHFVDDAEFDRMVDDDDFYEWAHVFGHRYGTPKGHIRAALKEGQDFLFDIDWQGTQQLYQQDRQDVVSVLILPPSLVELRHRLEVRAQDSEVRKLKTADGAFLWQPGLVEGQPDRLLGYPVVEAEDMPDVATGAFPIAFGNFRAGYLIAERTATQILRDPFTNKPFVHFYATKRVGGQVLDSAAIKLLRIEA